MVSIRKAKKGFQLRKRAGGSNNTDSNAVQDCMDSVKQRLEDREKAGMVIIGMTLMTMFLLLAILFRSDSQLQKSLDEKTLFSKLRRTKAHPQLQDNKAKKPMKDTMNAVALDIYQVLDCEKFFNETLAEMKGDDEKALKGNDRRLQEVEDEQHGDDNTFDVGGELANENEEEEDAADDKYAGQANRAGLGDGPGDSPMDDDFGGGMGGEVDFDAVAMNARHLFCLAASPDPPAKIVKEIKCDASETKRSTLLKLWSSARAQGMNPDTLKEVLEVTEERIGEIIQSQSYNIWSPRNDDGTQFVINQLNSDRNVDNGGILGLSESLGEGKLFVDVGSCLGLTTLAVTNKYPGTQVVSIEPASPNWLIQEMNLRCNLDDDTFQHKIKVVLAGVGPNDSDEDNMMAKLLWRSSSTTSARAWTPENETADIAESKDIELVVRLRKLKSVLAEAEVYGPHTIDVLNVDCSGCEYNLIPALSEKEFEAIPTIMGGVHWGYIPTSKLPSSERAKLTHQRLCSHENVAHRTKECCAFPDMPVQSSVPGEVLVKDESKSGKDRLQSQSTVMDVVIDGLCDNFDKWAEEHHLYTVPDDWGWFELTSRAAV
ncbi:unnamed protein product [Cylindrotheca closterium]|uniref:Uncharacterized protein n=1 Tax=Cylindrotheca closterium TaxID=2856 RepID=A0AAD2CM43_9STRA|nr:unnamed protein product [Cylindrotheca closterium]